MKTKKITKILSFFLLMLLFLGLFAMLARMTKGTKESFKTFTVHYQEQELTSESRLLLPPRTKHRFDVAYDNGAKGYYVSIIPNDGEDINFTFTVGGRGYAYKDVGDITKGFKLTKYDEYFILDFSEGISMEKILEKVYGKNVEIPNVPKKNFLCTLLVSSYDESVTYYIDFAFDARVEGVILDKDKVVF